jgi:hypothetical protein
MIKKNLAIALVISGMVISSLLNAAEEDNNNFPILGIGKLRSAPTIDGKIDPEEWQGATAVTGMYNYMKTLVPEVQQVIWYIAYDDKNLYLAMHSPHKKGTYPVARQKGPDNKKVLFEDHVEIQICKHPRLKATKSGYGFYKIMVNAKESMIDEFFFNGTPGTEALWSTGGKTKCYVAEDYWDLEMSIALERLRLKKLDGRDLTIQLVRTDWCGGIYFAGLVGRTWKEWSKFMQVDFAPTTPALQFTRLGEIMSGNLDAVMTVTNPNKQAIEIKGEVIVEDASGKVIYKNKQDFKLDSGKEQELKWQKSDLPVSTGELLGKDPARNHLQINLTYKLNNKEHILYKNRIPFTKLDDEYRRKFLDPWLAGRPQSGEWEYKFAYQAYSNVLETSVDLDFFGLPEKLKTANKFEIEIINADDKKVLKKAGALIKNLASETVLVKLPELSEGKYQAKFSLYDASGNKISEKVADFIREKFLWEHNTLGKSEEVIHPYRPMKVSSGNNILWNASRTQYTKRQAERSPEFKNAIQVVGRNYIPSGSGLPEQIIAAAPTGNTGVPLPLLVKPITLEAASKGKKLKFIPGKMEYKDKQMHQVELVGTGDLGTIKTKVNAHVEYDGWYKVDLNLQPEKPLELDYLDMVIDLKSSEGKSDDDSNIVDTLYAQRAGGYSTGGSYYGDIPSQKGTHFKSSQLLKCNLDKYKDWKTFIPQLFIGSGDRGLWFFAWSDKGWELKDDQPCVTVERLADGNVRLRIRLLAGPVKLGSPRNLEFALQASPIKPNHKRYRTALEEGWLMHDTRGTRYWGDSPSSFVMPEKGGHYEALRKFLLYGPRYQKDKEYSWWHNSYKEALGRGAHLALYGSTNICGWQPKEFDSFGGEWIGQTNWKPNLEGGYYRDNWNYGGSIQWKTDRQLSRSGLNWTESQSDFFIWYHKKLMEKCGLNGTWWDNSSIFTVREYDPELGRMDTKWNNIYRRKLMKRLNVLGYEVMRAPTWIMNYHVDMAWCQVFWMVENYWNASCKDETAVEHFNMGKFRALARPKCTLMLSKPWLQHFEGTTPEQDLKVKRSLVAMLLSHDIWSSIVYNSPEFYIALKRKLNGLVNPANTDNCLFSGYWKTDKIIKAPEDIKVSVYKNAFTKTAAILFYNTSKKDKYLAGTTIDVNKTIGGGKLLTASRVYDLESGKEVKTVFREGRYEIVDPYPVKWHDFRVLAIEAK